MITIKNLDKKEKELLQKMDNQELQRYIKNIVHEYYNSIINQDKIQLNQCMVHFNKVNEIFADKNIDKYITYCLITGFNEILLNSANNDFKLIDVKEPLLNPAKDNLLYRTKFDAVLDAIFFKKVFDKEKEISESINSNEDILELFNYSSYMINRE